MTLSDIVATNIKLVREQRKLSQQALARKARISISYVSMLERGARTPPLDTLELLAKALGVPPLDLCKETKGARKGKR